MKAPGGPIDMQRSGWMTNVIDFARGRADVDAGPGGIGPPDQSVRSFVLLHVDGTTGTS